MSEPSYPGGPMVSVDPGVYETPDNPFITSPEPFENGSDLDNDTVPDIEDSSPDSPFYD